METNLPKGYICICGTFHEFVLWVYAHWNEDIDATCTKCGHHNTIRRGVRTNERKTEGEDRSRSRKSKRAD